MRLNKLFTLLSSSPKIPARGGFALVFTLLALTGAACLPGGIIQKGGHATDVRVYTAATLTRGANYEVVCWDEAEANRRKNEKKAAEERAKKGEEEKKKESGVELGPPVKYVKREDYKGGCEQEGEHSMFFLFNLIPATAPLNPEYALSQAVQRLEGDTMVNIRAWHEVHYYSVLGRVSVFKVRGDVIRFILPGGDKKEEDKKKNSKRRRGR